MLKFKSVLAAVVAVSLVGFASATERVVQVRVEQPVKVVRQVQVVRQVRVEQPVQVVRQVNVVNVQRRAVQVEEVDVVESRRVGPVRAAVRALFGLDDTVEVRRTVRVAR